ncbi:CBS domain-containing protein [Cytobacillus depressus]|uniref:CBS domain-containing protein n=1 Tax=Cytobacillus depressus TaxID=1602942 RepID=A0A6L3V9R2_9BACI|nr:CBS domain-containing protein [Cytobacillus depressus]KAB2338350.1 CBS domain-containing protein [Cytobacillus depressus]
MFVKSILIPRFSSYTIDQEASIQSALETLEKHLIDGLPVLDGDHYVGLITRYTIYETFFTAGKSKEEYLQNTKVKDIATHKEKYLKGNEIFEKTLLNLKDFPLLAVLDEKQKFLGIVTRFDVLAQFQSAFGMNKPGVRIALTSSEIEGRLAKLAEIAHQFHEHIISIVTFDETDKLVRRIVMKVEKKNNIKKFIQKLEDSGFRILKVDED